MGQIIALMAQKQIVKSRGRPPGRPSMIGKSIAQNTTLQKNARRRSGNAGEGARSIYFKPLHEILFLVVVTCCCDHLLCAKSPQAPSLLSSQSPITPQLNA